MKGLDTTRKEHGRLPEKGNPNSPGAKPVHLIITIIVDSDHFA